MEPISQESLEESMQSLSCSMQPCEPEGFRLMKKLQDAPRNHGSVHEALTAEGLSVAVKRMPNWWVQSGHTQFLQKYPKQVERPWWDFSIVKELDSRDFPHVCKFLGVFQDLHMTYMVTSLATEGDLFSWCQQLPSTPEAREAALRPVVAQLLDAVRWLHDLGVAHGDLSLENILIAAQSCGDVQVKLIDFGMSTLGRMCTSGSTLAGKDVFRAPEVYEAVEYDAFLADVFSLGLVLYAMALLDYPWATTAPGKSEAFDYVRSKGIDLFLRKKKKVRGKFLPDLLSKGLLDLISGMLAAAPQKRFCLGEACMLEETGRVCAWTSSWLADLRPQSEVVKASAHRAFSNASLSTMVSESDVE
eukprot:TRINITY_DN23808_c0_g1_i1.p1 TRINITY_DN23808_c0_g1~~TRINITY_DN23808_c0_g1_i1.p1  ORF type:complete len:408 (-),score=70.23 TRINITY_DN23808_c0_g1_i1:8-1087(-)